MAGYTVMTTGMTSGSSQSREKTVIPTGPCAGSTITNGKHGGRCRDDSETKTRSMNTRQPGEGK